MRFDSLIFDLDGTLWDCSKASADAFNLAYKKFNIDKEVTREFVRSISGKPSTECDKILLSGISSDLCHEISRCFDALESSAVQEQAQRSLYADVQSGLELLAPLYKLFVVSNCGERYLEIFLRHTPIGALIVDSECFGRTRKLKHENIRCLVDRQKCSSPCYIGDTAGDEEAASKAGVPFFHAAYGFGKPVGSPLGFGSFMELTKYFEELAGPDRRSRF